MRSSQTTTTFPLSSVKPLENIEAYRDFCIAETEKAVAAEPGVLRTICPSCSTTLSPIAASGKQEEEWAGGGIDQEINFHDPTTPYPRLNPRGGIFELSYVACSTCGSLFLQRCAGDAGWSRLLERIGDHKHSPAAFHSSIAASRNENVFRPKLEWIQHTLRLQEVSHPRLLEFSPASNSIQPMLAQSSAFAAVSTLTESVTSESSTKDPVVSDAVLLFESLDRSSDPAAFLNRVARHVKKGGLVFLTALVSSGFDVQVLGLRNLYLYPPDRTNCFSLEGLVNLVKRAGFTPIEISTPGVLDVEIVTAHLRRNPNLPLSPFEWQIVSSAPEKREALQTFLQENLMSSFARIVARLP